MTPDIEKIEHLLNAKTFAQLTASERELVLAHLSGAAEYEHMRETLLRVKKIFTAEAAAVASDAGLKEQILNRFEQNRPRPASLWQRMQIFFQTLVPSPGARFAGAMALLLLVVSVGFFMWPEQRPEIAQQQPVVPHPANGAVIPKAADETRTPGEAADATEVQTAAARTPQAVEKTSPMGASDQAAAGAVSPAIVSDAKADRISAPPTYTNSDGYLQYNNNARLAEGSGYEKDISDAYKNYTPAKDRVKREEAREIPLPREETVIVAAEAKAKKQAGTEQDTRKLSQATLQSVDSGGRTDRATGDKEAEAAPVWPGTETRNRYEALRLTDEKLRTFFSEETKAAYRPAKREKYVRLTLTFSETGRVTGAEASGNLTPVQQKAFEEKALLLPAFRLPEGTTGTRENTYYLPLRK